MQLYRDSLRWNRPSPRCRREVRSVPVTRDSRTRVSTSSARQAREISPHEAGGSPSNTGGGTAVQTSASAYIDAVVLLGGVRGAGSHPRVGERIQNIAPKNRSPPGML